MDTETDILERFQNINIGMSGDRRAPHKPLLLIWAIARCLRDEHRLVPYEVVDEALSGLLRIFGPHGRPLNTHYPFWRLHNDGIWELDRPKLVRTTNSGDPLKEDLREYSISGGLTISAHEFFQNNPLSARYIAEWLVAEHFPSSIFVKVFEAVSFPQNISHTEESGYSVKWSVSRRRLRDSSFRTSVLSAYENTCAVCELAIRFQETGQPLAIEAAHVKWHVNDGPSDVENGLALCALHHSLFDTGAFTVLPDLTVQVSPELEGNGLDQALGQYDSKCLRVLPSNEFSRPNPKFLRWHGQEVYKSPQLLDAI